MVKQRLAREEGRVGGRARGIAVDLTSNNPNKNNNNDGKMLDGGHSSVPHHPFIIKNYFLLKKAHMNGWVSLYNKPHNNEIWERRWGEGVVGKRSTLR
jgi:hypothetical protein